MKLMERTAMNRPVKNRPTKHRPSAVRSIPVRRLDVDLSETEFDRWLVKDDPIFSHFLATLSAVFPRGEEFFVESVKRNRDAVGDDEILRKQVKAFIGQEAMHGREHRRINKVLAQRGYNTERAEAGIDRVLNVVIKVKPKTIPLAVTAAAEHLTGILAEAALGSEQTRQTLFAQPEVNSLITWHALEELEHKNVAFDVLKRSTDSYFIRMAGFAITLTFLGGFVLIEWMRSVRGAKDQITAEHRRNHRANFKRQKLLSPWALRQLAKYMRPGFHPDDIETDHLVREWRERLTDRTTVTAGIRDTPA